MKLRLCTLLLSLGLTISASANPFLVKKLASKHRIQAIGNANQIYLALLTFTEKHGIRPGEEAAKKIEGAKFETANDCFRQLFLGTTDLRTEAIFYASSKISETQDNDIGTIENKFLQACQKGEVGFLYVDSPAARSGAPLVAAPLMDGTSTTFDHAKYGGKAIILHSDGSVKTHDINPDTGKVEIKINGKMIDIFSQENPIFRSAPNIKYPEPK